MRLLFKIIKFISAMFSKKKKKDNNDVPKDNYPMF